MEGSFRLSRLPPAVLKISTSQALASHCFSNYNYTALSLFSIRTSGQGGITCGAIDEPRKSSKAIDERVIINFCDKNVVIARFRDKNGVFDYCDKMS